MNSCDNAFIYITTILNIWINKLYVKNVYEKHLLGHSSSKVCLMDLFKAISRPTPCKTLKFEETLVTSAV